MAIQKIRSQRVHYDIETFIGNDGQIFYNETVGDLRLSDGVTPGGIPLLLGGATIEVSPTPPADPANGALWFDPITETLKVYSDGFWIRAVPTTGDPGLSAYEVAVKNGFTGTELEWLESLNGTDGINGIGITNIVDNGDGTLTLEYGEGLSIVTGNLTGPKGDKGDTGDTGPKGDKGDTGSQGLKGDKGDTGDTGPKGDKGDTGDTGPKGDTGDTGPKGDKGDTGDTGPKGDTGDTGPKGDQGDPGLAATITVGTVSTGETGDPAVVTNVGTSLDAVLNFTLPRGEKGDPGNASTIASQTLAGVVKMGNPAVTNINIAVDGTISVPKGAGINTVADIPDVNTTSGGAALNDGALLIWNASSNRWDTLNDLRADTTDGGFF